MARVVRAFAAIAVALVLTLFGAGLAWADEGYGPRLVTLSVVDRDTGQEKQVWYHQGRYFVAGDAGRRYSLRINNLTGERVLAVLSVDGINVISGDTADFGGRGYILPPYGRADINGWRKSQYEIAAFEFAPLPQSYAARTGRPGEVGVIGMAVFRERRPPPRPRYRGRHPEAVPPPPSAPGSAEADAAVGAQSAPDLSREEKLGTGHGRIEQDYSSVAPFVRATATPDAVRIIEYDALANLAAAGVIPMPEPYPRRPRAFPGSQAEPGYVPDPPPY